MSEKRTRLDAIMKIVSEEKIATQQDLAERLMAAGYNVTQATVSRDIRELRLVKAMRDGVYCYQGNEHRNMGSREMEKFRAMMQNSVTSVAVALNQVVIHSHSGMAQAVCAMMDDITWTGVLGTIAGEDTILIITDGEYSAQKLAEQLDDMRRDA